MTPMDSLTEIVGYMETEVRTAEQRDLFHGNMRGTLPGILRNYRACIARGVVRDTDVEQASRILVGLRRMIRSTRYE